MKALTSSKLNLAYASLALLLSFLGLGLGLGLGFGSVFAATPVSDTPFAIQIDRTELSLTTEQSASLDRFIDEVSTALPPSLKSAFKKPIVIQFKKLGDESLSAPDCADGNSEDFRSYPYGREPEHRPWQKQYLVEINEGFLAEIFKGSEKATAYACGHRNFYRLALATAIHEISHHYDLLNVEISPEAENDRKTCEFNLSTSDTELIEKDRYCRELLRTHTTVSGRPGFMALMGISDTPKHANMRTPDPKEYRNERERFAVNMEYFALDPEFECRRPNIYKFLSQHFNYSPKSGCEKNNTVPVASYSAEATRIVQLDPERIYEIHYLLADSGDDISSKFGHAMLRLVTCSPKRAKAGPECLKDVDSHIVVSYRANVRGITIDNWLGLTGKYPSQLYLLKFLDVIQEYTIGESRKVLSYPLKLNRDQLASLVGQVNEEFWQYQNRYFFVGNNCATETLNLIRASLPDHPVAVDAQGVMTPKNVRRLLIREDLLDTSALASENALGRYVFPSLYEKAKDSFAELEKIGLPAMVSSLDQFLAFKAHERTQVTDALVREHPEQKQRILANLLELESLIQSRALQKMQSRAAALSQSSDATGVIQAQDQLLPWKLAPVGYGIPLGTEKPSEEMIRERAQKVSTLIAQNMEKLKPEMTSELTELNESGKNVLKLISSLKTSGKSR